MLFNYIECFSYVTQNVILLLQPQTQQNSSGMNEAALEKPSTPTHSPPPPPSEGGAKQPFDAGDTGWVYPTGKERCNICKWSFMNEENWITKYIEFLDGEQIFIYLLVTQNWCCYFWVFFNWGGGAENLPLSRIS